MSTIAVVTVDAGGNVPPMLRVAEALAARGHRIELLGQPRQSPLAAERGFGFRGVESLRGWNSGVRRSVPTAVRQAVALLADRRIGAEVAALAREAGAELAVTDCLLASTHAPLRAAGIPDVVLFHTLYSYWTGDLARGPVGMLARLRGTDPRAAWAGAAARVVASDRTLDPGATADGVDWVGAVERGEPRRPAPDEPPLVVVSLSTAWLPGQSAAYQRIVDALGGLPLRGVVTLGGLAPDRPLRVPPNVEVVDRADHGALFRRASLLVGHGGHSTTLRALAHDVPMVLMPMHPLLDQPAVAAAVARAGAAEVVSRKASAEHIRSAVARVLASGPAAVEARALGTRVRSGDAAVAAADAVERELRARRPSAQR
ncbi:glycosyltransferase [Leifsonia shinshuensis]|uniref:UDP:flavonoid glycosyltransferase YjiC (YdhE family) n=1 Tax=Leifsonia shinshuensis TaxID=150026 RepID=A0A853CR34_9MICO|nr:nucleotide disphospho-sugar-binding domain-containing protein [Leifsonia shinshuensis]NYJ22778.1 UDP:flavonoid glycosyltransferase YjiC (YdhE family) [Leifsonia shinshuensis]